MTGEQTHCPKCLSVVSIKDKTMFNGFACKNCNQFFSKKTVQVVLFEDCSVDLEHVLLANKMTLCDNVDKVKVCAFFNDMVDDTFYYDDFTCSEDHAAVSEALRIFQTIKGGDNESENQN